jgi:transposase-like protein
MKGQPLMKTLRIVGGKGNRKKLEHLSQRLVQDNLWYGPDGRRIDSQFELISLMLPSAIKAFYNDLNKEFKELCGERYSRQGEHYRWGESKGSIILGKQKVAIKKPRIRNIESKEEGVLPSYERFQDPNIFQHNVFIEGMKKVSQRDYEKGLPKIASSFGVSKSSVSRRWVKETGKRLDELLNRDLKPLDIVAIFIDGKRFVKYGVVVALGVAMSGKKFILGIYQSSTENHQSCLSLLNDLHKRGLSEEGILFIIDGGSGLNKALEIKYQVHKPQERRAVRIRCHYHKWENIRGVLDEKDASEIKPLFWGMRDARTFSEAKVFSDTIEDALKRSNLSALKSYQEAKDDLLMLHKLNLNSELRRFFATTNPIESLNSLTEEDLRRVKHWEDSRHFQRWLATSCLYNEKRMRRIYGYRALPLLKEALKIICHNEILLDTEVANVS